jgi:hypothetical protein
MEYTKQLNLTEFDFWSSAKEHKFTYNELKQLEYIMQDLFCDKIPSDTYINDLFWFDEQYLCECIGLNFNKYENR